MLLAAHYHVTANYSGDSNYSSGVATFVLPVLETATTSVSASANPLAPGNSVTLTATVTPNGTPNTVVENGSGSSSYWVPTGTVTFMDGSTVLGHGYAQPFGEWDLFLDLPPAGHIAGPEPAYRNQLNHGRL